MRNRVCQDLMHFKEEHDGLLRDMGWTAPHVETEEGEPKLEVACSMCDYKAGSYAALAVHENRRHGVWLSPGSLPRVEFARFVGVVFIHVPEPFSIYNMVQQNVFYMFFDMAPR